MNLLLHSDPLLAAVVLDIAKYVVFTLFVISAVVLSVVILLQEGKGGGLGSAFGGAAADAFGVKAGTVNKFTTYLASTFLGLALLYAGLSSSGDRISTDIDEGTIPTEGLAEPMGEGAPAESTPTDAPADENAPADAPTDVAPGDDG